MKLKQKIKNFFIAHPMDDKSKGRIQGIALGFGVCAVGFLVMCLAIGCSPQSEDVGESSSLQKKLAHFDGSPSTLVGASFTWSESPHFYMSTDFQFLAGDGNTYDGIYGNEPETDEWEIAYYTSDNSYTYIWTDFWVKPECKTFVVLSDPADPADLYDDLSYTGTWDLSNVGSSSDTSSDDVMSSEPPAVGSTDKGFSVTLSETTAFSAWAKNPSNNDYAINYDSNAPFVLYTGSSSGGANTHITSAYNTYFVGEFSISGVPNRSFDTIGLVTLNLSVDNSFCLNGDSEAVQVSDDMYQKGAFIISECYYVDSITDTRLQVFSMGSQRATLNGSEITALVGPTWINQGFRNLDFLDGSRLIDINGLSASALFQMENNSLSSSSATSTWVLGNSSTGVFGLIASAFGAIGGILGIALIPGLTIGTLLFIPLVVTIVLAIVKMMGK